MIYGCGIDGGNHRISESTIGEILQIKWKKD